MSNLKQEVLHSFDFEGTECSLSTGKLAVRAQGAVIGRMGDTVVLATVCTKKSSDTMDFFPFIIEYMERMYAGGLISSSRFVKREGRPSQGAILNARMLDRAVRSRFPDGYRTEVQAILTVLSYDEKNDPLIIGSMALSSALLLAGLPFNGPLSVIRVGYDGKETYVYNEDPSFAEQENGDSSIKPQMNFTLGTDGDIVTMIDVDGKEFSESVAMEGMRLALEKAKGLIEEQKTFIGKVEELAPIVKEEYELVLPTKDLISEIRTAKKKEIEKALLLADREEKEALLDEIKMALHEEYEGKYSKAIIGDAFAYIQKEIVQKLLLEERKRTDGRALDEIREISVEVGVLPRAHGSAIFKRGLTHTLTVVTLGSARLAQLEEGMEGESKKRYMHHYNAPDYTVGEAGRYSYYPGRREIGHGALAEKALEPVLPSEEVFPYTIRVVNDVMSQSGSSSMASTCGSTVALMDAGVPIKKPVAGIAMGVVVNDSLDDWVIMTDIAEYEDFFGHMDFKVTGTRDGITAIQMDNKKEGLPIAIFEEALEAAKKARIFLIEKMEEVIDKPRVSVSSYAPKIDIMKVNKDKIGEIIGPGGKNIKNIIEVTGAEINIDDDGSVTISAISEDSRKKAIAMIEDMIAEPEVGKVYKGVVASIKEFGVFVDVSGNISGLVHVSEMSDSFVKDPSTLVKVGQEVNVKVVGIDEKGRVKMSMKNIDSK